MRYRSYFRLFVLFAIVGLHLVGCGAPVTKNYTIGVINLSVNQESTVDGFKKGLAEQGFIEGQNTTYIYDGPANTNELDAVAQNLVKAKVDLILSITTSATTAAKKATTGTNIPVVFIPVTDPVKAGLVDNLLRPGGNITGVTSTVLEGKRLEWLLQVDPRIKQVYIVYNPKDPSPVQALKTVNETAAKLGVELITREAVTLEEASAAFENIPEEADAIFLLPDYLVSTNMANIVQRTDKLGLSTSGPNVTSVNDGILTAYGVNLAESARKQAARQASQILRGTKPADLPVETAEIYSVINLKTAQTIGLDISDVVLRQANIIIH